MCDPTIQQAPDRRGTYLLLAHHALVGSHGQFVTHAHPPPRDMDDVDNDGGKEKNVVIVFKGNGKKRASVN